MNPRKKLLVLGLIAAVILGFSAIWYAYKTQKWEEYAFKNRPMSELQEDLRRRNKELEWCDPNGFIGGTGRQLQKNQRVMRFTKRKGALGTTVGFVVIERRPEGDIIVDIVPFTYMDAP